VRAPRRTRRPSRRVPDARHRLARSAVRDPQTTAHGTRDPLVNPTRALVLATTRLGSPSVADRRRCRALSRHAASSLRHRRAPARRRRAACALPAPRRSVPLSRFDRRARVSPGRRSVRDDAACRERHFKTIAIRDAPAPERPSRAARPVHVVNVTSRPTRSVPPARPSADQKALGRSSRSDFPWTAFTGPRSRRSSRPRPVAPRDRGL